MVKPTSDPLRQRRLAAYGGLSAARRSRTARKAASAAS